MKGVDVEEPWNVIEDPPCGKSKPILPVEGTWRLIGHENFDAFLSAVGVTPLVATMVLRSDTMVTIYEDLVSSLPYYCICLVSIRWRDY